MHLYKVRSLLYVNCYSRFYYACYATSSTTRKVSLPHGNQYCASQAAGPFVESLGQFVHAQLFLYSLWARILDSSLFLRDIRIVLTEQVPQIDNISKCI